MSDDVKHVTIGLRVTSAEARAIRAAAKAEDRTVSNWIRGVVLRATRKAQR